MADSKANEQVPTGAMDVSAEPRRRGFAAMTPEERRALGSKGGRVAHARGTANKFNSETGSAAGKVPHERGTAYRWTSDEARRAGQMGRGVARRRRPRTDTPA